MPGSSETRKRKLKRSQKSRARTDEKKEQRKIRTEKIRTRHLSTMMSRVFETKIALGLLSHDEEVQRSAIEALHEKLAELERTSEFRFVVLDDFNIMAFTKGRMEGREVYVYDHTAGVRKKK
jgi:hypothetical protein